MQLDQLAGDDEFRARRQPSLRDRAGAFRVNDDGFRRALRPTLPRWPKYDVLYGTDGPGSLLDNKIFAYALFQGLPPNHTFARELGVDLVLARRRQHEFVMMRGNRNMG